MKKDLDDTSITYIDKFLSLIKLCKIKDDILVTKRFAWTDKDRQIMTMHAQMMQHNGFPYSEYGYEARTGYVNKYGLIDLPQDVLESINGKDIIDGGGYIGDTALLFRDMFDKSKIYAFEPMQKNFDTLSAIANKYDSSNSQIKPIKLGLSDKKATLAFDISKNSIDSTATLTTRDFDVKNKESAEVITLDSYVKKHKLNVGLIKFDIEGWEPSAIRGASQTIKEQKPVLVVAIYHTPDEFFELKGYLESLNVGYKFMIRRSGLCLPTGELVLIAY